MSCYSDYGCKNRDEYLQYLADEYNLPIYMVIILARILPKDKEFDELPRRLQELKQAGFLAITVLNGDTKITLNVGTKEVH